MISWETDKTNRTNISDELLLFYDGSPPPTNNCHVQHPHLVAMETVSKQRHHRTRRDESLSSLTSSSSSSAAAAAAAEVQTVGSCRLHRWYLDFARLGWTQWIRYPTGYYANYCAGACSITASGASDNSTTVSNHAFVKSLYLAATNRSDVTGPQTEACCVSLRLSPINILYNNDDGQWVMTEMAEMTADQCGCL